jgi:hypothetical protein
VSEGACPFCGAAFDAAFGAAPAPVPPSRRLSRAALYAYGTGVLVLAPAAFATVDCTSSVESGPNDDAGFNTNDAYGLPAIEEGGIVGGADAYGAPPPFDSGLDDVHAGSADAGDGSVGDAGGDAGADGAASDAAGDGGETD